LYSPRVTSPLLDPAHQLDRAQRALEVRPHERELEQEPAGDLPVIDAGFAERRGRNLWRARQGGGHSARGPGGTGPGNTGEVGEGHGEAARLGDHKQDLVARPEPAGPPALLEHDEDARRAGVALGGQVGEPARLGNRQAGRLEQLVDLGAEMLGAVMAQQMVDPSRVDQPAEREARELCDPELDQAGQCPSVLAQAQHASGLRTGDGRLVEPGPTGARRPRLPRARVHARRVLVRVRGEVHPVDPQRHARGAGLVLQHDRAGAVRQHPAKEFRVETGPLPALVAARLEAAADELGADRDGDRVLAEAHQGDCRLEGGHTRAAHPTSGQRLQRPAAEASVDHGGKAGQQHVPLRRPGGEHADVGERNPALGRPSTQPSSRSA
jgi:hypothetical protein